MTFLRHTQSEEQHMQGQRFALVISWRWDRSVSSRCAAALIHKKITSEEKEEDRDCTGLVWSGLHTPEQDQSRTELSRAGAGQDHTRARPEHTPEQDRSRQEHTRAGPDHTRAGPEHTPEQDRTTHQSRTGPQARAGRTNTCYGGPDWRLLQEDRLLNHWCDAGAVRGPVQSAGLVLSLPPSLRRLQDSQRRVELSPGHSVPRSRHRAADRLRGVHRWPWPLTHPGSENTELQILSLCVCLGYFLFDLSWCLLHRSEGPVMLAHHAASVLGILLTLWLGSSGCETCGVIFGSELTNPLLQSRWFLRELGLYESLLGDAVDLLFIGLFAFVRVGVGTAMFYRQLTSPRPALVMKLGGVVMYVLAWVFMVDIARFGFKKSRIKYNRWKERRQLRDRRD
ncbi:hypothetical protein WMY93_008319 [Mugilogobius chulae]|uniref:TLC domain-containing protein n=1 Tax=Mugilogobius chulae TaxID=88201 RepID=A0AAW0PUG0_9GOBI